MTENQNPFDAHFHHRLSDLESAVPNDLFDRLQARRGAATPEDAPLRDRLTAHESLVSEHVFDAVLAARARKKRRRIIFWRSVMAAAALCLIGAFLFELSTKNKAVKTEIVSNENLHDAAPSNAKIIVNNVNIDNKTQLNKELVDKNTASKVSKMAENGIYTEGSPSEIKTKNLDVKTDNFELKNGVNSTVFDLKNNAKFNDSELKNARQSSGENGINSANSTWNSPEMSENGVYTEGSSIELIDKNDALKTALNDRLNPQNFAQLPLDFLNIMLPKTLDLSVEKRKNPCTDPENGCPTFGSGRRRRGERAFYVDAFVAPEYVMRRFTKNLDESEKLLAARDSVEQTQYAVSTGVRASVVFGNGLAVRTGLIFNQINERAQFDSLGVGSITTTYKEVVLPNGQRDTISTIITITDGIFRKNRYNLYRSLDIPLQIGYEMPMKNGWTLGFNGGVNINLTAWQKADIIGTDLKQLTVSSGINEPNPVFRTRLGMSLTGSVAAYRQLTKALQVVIEPSIRYGLQPITRSDYALKQQYATAGLIVGLRLRL